MVKVLQNQGEVKFNKKGSTYLVGNHCNIFNLTQKEYVRLLTKMQVEEKVSYLFKDKQWKKDEYQTEISLIQVWEEHKAVHRSASMKMTDIAFIHEKKYYMIFQTNGKFTALPQDILEVFNEISSVKISNNLAMVNENHLVCAKELSPTALTYLKV